MLRTAAQLSMTAFLTTTLSQTTLSQTTFGVNTHSVRRSTRTGALIQPFQFRTHVSSAMMRPMRLSSSRATTAAPIFCLVGTTLSTVKTATTRANGTVLGFIEIWNATHLPVNIVDRLNLQKSLPIFLLLLHLSCPLNLRSHLCCQVHAHHSFQVKVPVSHQALLFLPV